jgi:chromosome segregation ATPase
LEQAGKTPAQLREMVAWFERRLHLRAKIEAADALSGEWSDLHRQVGTANAALEAAKADHAQAIEPLQSRLAQIEAVRSGARVARDELYQTADQEIQQQIAGATARRQEAAQRRAAVDAQIAEREKWLTLPDLGVGPDGSVREIETTDGRGWLRSGPHPRKTQAGKELPGLRADRERITAEMEDLAAENQALKDEAATV